MDHSYPTLANQFQIRCISLDNHWFYPGFSQLGPGWGGQDFETPCTLETNKTLQLKCKNTRKKNIFKVENNYLLLNNDIDILLTPYVIDLCRSIIIHWLHYIWLFWNWYIQYGIQKISVSGCFRLRETNIYFNITTITSAKGRVSLLILLKKSYFRVFCP